PCRRMTSMPRLTRIYTKTGDEGMTGLGGGKRVPKDSRRVEAYGTVDELNYVVGPLANFLLPGGSPGAAQLHVARTTCRRAERVTTALARDEAVGATVLPYLNRLSDALFVMARYENHIRGVAEPLWDP